MTLAGIRQRKLGWLLAALLACALPLNGTSQPAWTGSAPNGPVRLGPSRNCMNASNRRSRYVMPEKIPSSAPKITVTNVT